MHLFPDFNQFRFLINFVQAASLNEISLFKYVVQRVKLLVRHFFALVSNCVLITMCEKHR